MNYKMWAIVNTNTALLRCKQSQQFVSKLSGFFEMHNHHCMRIGRDNCTLQWCEHNVCPQSKKHNHELACIKTNFTSNFIIELSLFLEMHDHICVQYTNDKLIWCKKYICSGVSNKSDTNWFESMINYSCACLK